MKTTTKQVKAQLLELICALDANEKAYDEELQETWDRVLGEYAEALKVLDFYIGERA